MSVMRSGWIGVDLDGTLAEFDGEKWSADPTWIGEPILPMAARVRAWLDEGRDVRIMTARVAVVDHAGDSVKAAGIQRATIERWCREHFGRELPVTATKDYTMVELWDDRAVQVEPNTGRRMAIDAGELSRVTLVDETGRVYERFNLDVEVSLQDQGRTLKLFVKERA